MLRRAKLWPSRRASAPIYESLGDESKTHIAEVFDSRLAKWVIGLFGQISLNVTRGAGTLRELGNFIRAKAIVANASSVEVFPDPHSQFV